jgi:hypothetical protein
MGINWPLILNCATLISLLVAIISLIMQSRSTKFTTDINVLLELENIFNGKLMLETRKKASRALLSHKKLQDVEGVLDFFETIGLLVRKGAVDHEMVNNEFSDYAYCYWIASQEYIKQIRSKDPNYWINYDGLIKIMNKVNDQTYNNSSYLPSKDDINELLLVESKRVVS